MVLRRNTGKLRDSPVRDEVSLHPELNSELTIVIPAKNEVTMLPRLLASLARQDYEPIAGTRVLIADAGSTDGTIEAARGFRDRLLVEVVPGGLPSVGRNAGAKLATTKYILFLDADVELADPTLLRRAMGTMRRRDLHLATVSIGCRQGGFFDDLLYAGSNVMQYIGSRWKPFATGMFMLFEREAFWRLGGFNERALFAEDYLLSKGVARNRFPHRPRPRPDDESSLSQTRPRQDVLDVFQNDATHLGRRVLP